MPPRGRGRGGAAIARNLRSAGIAKNNAAENSLVAGREPRSTAGRGRAGRDDAPAAPPAAARGRGRGARSNRGGGAAGSAGGAEIRNDEAPAGLAAAEGPIVAPAAGGAGGPAGAGLDPEAAGAGLPPPEQDAAPAVPSEQGGAALQGPGAVGAPAGQGVAGGPAGAALAPPPAPAGAPAMVQGQGLVARGIPPASGGIEEAGLLRQAAASGAGASLEEQLLAQMASYARGSPAGQRRATSQDVQEVAGVSPDLDQFLNAQVFKGALAGHGDRFRRVVVPMMKKVACVRLPLHSGRADAAEGAPPF
mmetsp:Transcript_36878/g.92651  ORF Transcript_36878/g.92651 Transcript_36878/m.92651 type:complete len:306 (-) Transcript_36878:2389-3306(-)|eukprot:CAMPEP_0173419514 /NCGR_PEP_ID=MMETSP1357-20121228/1319_1 /TAXON_ID=77926 /ORGANISM="Hemiselmis rufescens, Strain PCC563" /LENGTH=305 /DNA_ID=CAMNT_0014382163 /DNA_START=14 /DNA_END=931 /DNA_ORIENTATION=+